MFSGTPCLQVTKKPRQSLRTAGSNNQRLLKSTLHVKETGYTALAVEPLNLHCTFRGDKQQVTIRVTITDTTPGIVAALIADPRTDTGSPGPLADPNNFAITTETPWVSQMVRPGPGCGPRSA